MKTLAYVGIIALGMLGLYLNIEYSGWVLAVGCLAIVCD